MIPQSSIQHIKDTARIEEIVGKFVTLKKDGPRFKGLCPFHNEKSPSFSVNPVKQIFKCFGCGVGGDVFTFVMTYEKKNYPDAVRYVASQYNIPVEDDKGNVIDPEKCKPEIRQVEASAEQEDGKWEFETKEFTEADIRFVIADKVWDYLLKTAHRLEKDATKEFTPEERLKSAIKRAQEVFKQYHFHSLTSYTIIKNRKATTIRATEHFPIYMFDEGNWKKVYKPMEPEKKNRFIYYGTRPKDFMHGLDAVNKAYLEIQKKLEEENEEEDEKKKAKKKKAEDKLSEIIYCSGGSDALNIAMLNLYPVWLNSESSKFTEGAFKNLLTKAQKIYQLPDIDKTGARTAHQLALEHLELYTIYLPDELKKKYVTRGYGKDARDYFKYWTAWDFFKLMKVAYPYRFWDVQPRFNKQGEFMGMGYNVRSKYMLNFLSRNGFYRFNAEGEKEGYIYIKITDNVVTKVEAKDIRDYVNRFIEDRKLDAELMDTFLNTTKLNETSISNLPYIEIDFTDFDKDNQWMFFENSVLKISAAAIEELSTKDCEKFVWEDEVLKHEVDKLDDYFTITHDADKYDITINNKSCLVLRYLINASRIFWREELETRLEGIADDAERSRYCELQSFTAEQMKLAEGKPKDQWEKYREENKWEIAGALLTPDEQREQKLHLINKIYTMGYMLHRYKNSSRAWCAWAMDNKITEMSESHGGSGKSICMKLLSHFMRTDYIEGRNQKITDNPHIWGNITKHTDFIFVDDCSQYLRFDFFYPSITGPMNCNPKNAKQYTIGFHDVGKMGFASNYPPYNIDPSAERRILYMVFSDYYHYNRFDEYREERRVYDDFGKNLIDDFTEEEWNLAANFLSQCLRFYLSSQMKINPPMDNVNKRNLKAEMGDAFQSWADVHFSADSDNFNKFLPREDLFEDFRAKTKQQFTPQKFLKSIKAWAHYNGHEFNPKEHLNKEGRIIRKHKHKDTNGNEVETTKEMFYLKAKLVQGELTLEEKKEDEKLPF